MTDFCGRLAYRKSKEYLSKVKLKGRQMDLQFYRIISDSRVRIQCNINKRPMDPELYRAAQSGNWEGIIKDLAEEDHHSYYYQQTPTGNTILHVLAQSSCDASEAAKKILAKKPHLALKKNARFETPLHMAARKGHCNIIRALIECAKGNENFWTDGEERLEEMLGTRNKDGNTALHEAVRFNCFDAVKLLVEEAPEFRYGQNFAGESPLYIAVDKAYRQIVALILSTCKSPSYLGPGKKTALHVAAARNFPECINLILEKLPNLAKKVDEFGWTALHYAAKFNHKEVVELLLTAEKSLAYLSASGDELKTALHIATIQGHLDVIQEILLHCPDCWEMTTGKFQNMLHLAINNEHKQVLEFILANSWASELINQKDVDGNTPLHLYVATKKLEGYNLVNQHCAVRNALNNAGMTPLDMIPQEAHKVTTRQSSIRDELVQAGATLGIGNVVTIMDEVFESDDSENRETNRVVAALIVTVTFAAGFTVPGGYDNNKGNEGMAVLSKKAAFIAFVVSDSLAFFTSIAAVLQQFMVKDKTRKLPKSDIFRSTKVYITVAMAFMVIAFLSGLYAVIPIRAIKIYLIIVGSVICLPIPLYLAFILLQNYADSAGQVMYNFNV
ncbi:hypothetical protein ACH5RR_036429 [Cinchona calisaya]|uniref:PGG domain-containing protein n=1 Tax=Cinchona calisaya TaxID=153742 RepID=A0ABD2Y522_9GENT